MLIKGASQVPVGSSIRISAHVGKTAKLISAMRVQIVARSWLGASVQKTAQSLQTYNGRCHKGKCELRQVELKREKLSIVCDNG